MAEVTFNESHFRRANHTVGAASILYLWLPESFWGVPKLVIPALSITIMTLGEIVRFKYGIVFKGLRSHEGSQISSFYWYALAVVLLLVLFPVEIAAPCIFLLAFVDPLAGETRNSGRPLLAASSPFLCFLLGILIFAIFGYSGKLLVIAATASAIGVAAERLHIPKVDDDLLLPILPALYLVMASWYVSLPAFDPMLIGGLI